MKDATPPADNRHWHRLPGADRQLVRALLAERVDQVLLLEDVADARGALGGFPLRAVGAQALWTPPSGAERGDALAPPDGWCLDTDRWQPELHAEPGAWRSPDDARYFMAGEVPWLRWDGFDGVVQASAVACADAETEQACLDAIVAAQRPVRVPAHRVRLQAQLADLGFRPGATGQVALLAPQLRRSRCAPLHRRFEVSMQDVERFGRESGDFNPLHFDDAFARSHGFEGRIAHGMLFSGWLTRLLGMEYPGPGTIFVRNTNVFLAPVYPGHRYDVVVSTPSLDEEKGTRLVVAQLLDERGRHCLVSYNDVLLRGERR